MPSEIEEGYDSPENHDINIDKRHGRGYEGRGNQFLTRIRNLLPSEVEKDYEDPEFMTEDDDVNVGNAGNNDKVDEIAHDKGP